MPWRGLMKMPVWHGLGFRWHSEVTCRKHREKALRCNGPHALPVIVSNVSIVDGSEVCVNRDRVLARLLASLGMLLLTALVSNAQQIDPKREDRKSTRLNSSHQIISYAVVCLKKKNKQQNNKLSRCK